MLSTASADTEEPGQAPAGATVGEAAPGTRVVVLVASPRDLPVMRPALTVLRDFGVDPHLRVLSAHRTQRDLITLVDATVDDGTPTVFVCAAGLAAHLAGLVAGRCTAPVIGVPLSRGALNGIDALLATVQMPTGVPVASVGIDAAENAALLALQMVALGDRRVALALAARRDTGAAEYRRFDPEAADG